MTAIYLVCSIAMFSFIGIGTYPLKVLIVININISKLNLAKCDEDDYTNWIPTDGVCICE